MVSSYDDWMRNYAENQDNPDDPNGTKQNAAFLSYLNGITTADATARECTKQIKNSETDTGDYLLSLLVDAAAEFPQAHQRLIELLDIVAHLSPKETRTVRTPADNNSLHWFCCELDDALIGRTAPQPWPVIKKLTSFN